MQTSPFQLVSGLDLIDVAGIDEARSYPLGPNCRVALFNKNEDVFYVKATDANGFPSLRGFKYEEIMLSDQESASGITLSDIREIMREEIKNALKERTNEYPISEQSDCTENNTGTKTYVPATDNPTKHNGHNRNSAKPTANTSAVESVKKQ